MQKPRRARPWGRYNIAMNTALHVRLRQHCEREGIAISRLIEEAVIQYLDEHERAQLVGEAPAVLGVAWRPTRCERCGQVTAVPERHAPYCRLPGDGDGAEVA